MTRLLFPLVLSAWCCLSIAAQTAASVRAEIDALLGKLQASGCQFNRNGSWHSAAEATTHLLRKLEYLEGKGAVQSAEQFIELAASRSSSSGTPYRVRCGKESPVDSGQWLTKELASVRGSGRSGQP